MKKLKTLSSYAAHARFLAECGDKTFWLARKHVAEIKTPYRSGPTVAVVPWNGHFVWVAEVGHKRYEVWKIPAGLFKNTEREALDEQLKGSP